MKKTLIENGRIVDPSQGIDKYANLIIEEGKVSEITDEAVPAEADFDIRIDAAGKIVCPGFIDIHMHEDEYDEKEDRLLKSMSESALLMGVTLDVGGNCGDNVIEPDRYLDLADRDGCPVNIGLLAGHTFLRNIDGRCDKYKPVAKEQIEEMTKRCRSYLDAGCLGVSFGVKYVPGTTWEEILSLVKLCRKDDKLAASHVRQDVEGVFDAAQELARMGKEGGVKVQFSHIGSMGGYGQMEKLLKNIEEYRASGIDMLCDCYPYSAFSTGIGETTYDEGFLSRYDADYDSVLIVNGKYAGKRCTEEIFRELRAQAPDTGTVGYFMKEEDVEMALLSPLVMVASDGVRHGGMGHPRASGTFPRFIRKYINEGKIGLSEGIAKMTSMPAERLNLPQKGTFRKGADGDVVIFDPEKICDKATYENGQIPPEGICWVLINGQIAADHGKIVNGTLGRAVRR